MLIDSVRDLEEWNSWQSGSLGGGKAFGDFGFKEKVVHMAKEKGDDGKVAFLESVGLSLSSAMNVARYLSRESLRALIHKVSRLRILHEFFFFSFCILIISLMVDVHNKFEHFMYH